MTPHRASASSVSAPGMRATDGTEAGVAENRGAGAGCRKPPSSMNVPRATWCGSSGASPIVSTGATHASTPSNAATHSARDRDAKAELVLGEVEDLGRAERCGEPFQLVRNLAHAVVGVERVTLGVAGSWMKEERHRVHKRGPARTGVRNHRF